MNRILTFLAATFLVLGAGKGIQAKGVDPALFGALPTIQDAELSPDGNTVAVIQNAGERSIVVFLDLNDPNATPKGVEIGEVKARDVRWVDNENLLLLASVTHDLGYFRSNVENAELARWISISKNDREMKILFKRDVGFYVPSPGAILATTPNSDGDAVFARWTPTARTPGGVGLAGGKLRERDDATGYSLFDVDVTKAKERIVEPGKPDTVDWIITADGDALMRVDYDDESGLRSFYYRKPGARRLDLVKTVKEDKADFATTTLFGLKPSTNEIYATGYLGSDKRKLYTIDPETMDVSDRIFGDGEHELGSVIYDADNATLAGYRYTSNVSHTVYFNETLQKTQNALENALKGATPVIISNSRDDSKMLVLAINSARPNDYYLFDRSTKNLAFFSSTYPSLMNLPAIPREKYNYTSSDGLKINGYLTLPPVGRRTNMPLIALPHGGPAARDDQSFDWWAAFYAARGYAVYQPNFRGSTGYGRAFREAGNGEWGRKMQDDITEGIERLAEDGLIDPARVCIVGGSYGGYAALAGATLTPDTYACAVSVNGVADLVAMLGEEANYGGFVEYWERQIGDRFRDMAEIRAVSPRHRAGYAKAPVMLIHGKDDVVVPFAQSELMYDALKSAGNVEVELVVLESEDHWLSKPETRTEMLRRSIEFIDRHIGQ